MFAEVCGLDFTDSTDDVMKVVEGMNSLFTKFDKITDEFQVYKVRVPTSEMSVTSLGIWYGCIPM